MKKVFISYHHAEPDSTLAYALASAIKERGHDPFIDVDIKIGERWAQRIDSCPMISPGIWELFNILCGAMMLIPQKLSIR